ncbi:MAG: hypothetical protein F6K54_21435 [Okeania sp. SIO3B5]|uniref:hypothetical protein n=1 Tax=Okeania sp. SIO3B5 TaxID=2607811 RepID=UPI001400A6A0|nr:hypothetical protein [Okeania sp. SIO3B5]NEO55404.1 hypothetical protein [Okeania sp. SIO3B5]
MVLPRGMPQTQAIVIRETGNSVATYGECDRGWNSSPLPGSVPREKRRKTTLPR